MITKVEQNNFNQKCICGEITSHSYGSVTISGKYIKLPVCLNCNSLEILCNNNADDSHSIMVTKIFAQVATLG